MKRAATKRKERASPEVIESDEEDDGSPITERRNPREQETSPNMQRHTLDGEEFDNEDMHRRQGRAGVPKPPQGGYPSAPSRCASKS
jgi:hypothetical protein